MEYIMTSEDIDRYGNFLHEEEKSKATIEKYRRDLLLFYAYLPKGKMISKKTTIEYKAYLCERYAPSSVNSMVAAVNNFFKYMEWYECRVKPLKIQRRIFADKEKDLTKVEYIRLVRAAEKRGNRRLMLVMETICSTGIRVSELPFITVEAVKRGHACVDCKGKNRTIFLPYQLQKILRKYINTCHITSGPVFITKSGKPLNRSNIWSDMKALCQGAGVSAAKVFPHNLRHLFAKTYYSIERDLGKLADLLGHSSVETTRIYTMTSGSEHEKQIERLGLII